MMVKKKYTCSNCGVVSVWKADWAWYGNYKEVDDGLPPRVVACSDDCRMALFNQGVVHTHSPKRPISARGRRGLEEKRRREDARESTAVRERRRQLTGAGLGDTNVAPETALSSLK